VEDVRQCTIVSIPLYESLSRSLEAITICLSGLFDDEFVIITNLAKAMLVVDTTGIHPFIAQCLTIVVVVFVSYIGSSKFTFCQKS
jgi:putative flippase GtrA